MSSEKTTYSQFACIGAGFSGIGLGATLKRWYNITDVQIFDRHNDLGGTWYINQYPGCACDIPSAVYSFSFEQKPDWTRVQADAGEIRAYLNAVANKYDLVRRMKFNTNVERCEWIDERRCWRIHARHIESDEVFYHESRFLFAGTGLLSRPQELDIPGAETFTGPIFHASRWRHDVELKNKEVVVFGNGCTAAQLLPAILGDVKHVTQVIRSKHWILPPSNARVHSLLRTVFFYIPPLMWLFRVILFVLIETGHGSFPLTERGAKNRARDRNQAIKYIKSTAPQKYHKLLIPDHEIGCKRRIMDSGYLKSLHSDKLTLTDKKVLKVVPEGIRTETGVKKADVLILANGYKTGIFLPGIEMIGRGGTTLTQHWDSIGGPEAYNCSAMSNFPNFFFLVGPNGATGHQSAVLAVENSVNYALRIVHPVLEALDGVVELRREAEEKYAQQVQSSLHRTVFNTGCQSWYTPGNEGKKWNSMAYPWSQYYFWYRSVFPVWHDWKISVSRSPE